MASTHPFNPVMHCCAVEPQAVNVLATRIITEGMYVNTSLFTAIPVSLSDFEAANSKLTNLIAQAKGNSNIIKTRDEQSGIVHEYMALLLIYAHTVCNHDIEKIILSGFDASNQPQPAVPPPMPVITKIIEGKGVGTYKAILKKTERKKLGVSNKSHSKGDNRYTVEISTTPDDEASWKIVLESAASTKLIFTGLVAGKNYIRIYGINSAGKGQLSTPHLFIPQL
ncbi:MAG: fibronectin type III domain-containing protein [Bacteroidales bacterium]|jgi:hypothetical protein